MALKRKYVAQSTTGKPQSSIYRGVSLHKGTLKYRANIKIKGKKIALGAYDNETDAAKAFDRAAIRYRGARAEVNFPVVRKKADAEQPEGNSSESSSKPSGLVHQMADATAGTADSQLQPVVSLQDPEAQMTMCTRSMSSFKEDSSAEAMLYMDAADYMGDLEAIDLSDVLAYEQSQAPSPFRMQGASPASDSSTSGGSDQPFQPFTSAAAPVYPSRSRDLSDAESDREVTGVRRLMSQQSIHSHHPAANFQGYRPSPLAGPRPAPQPSPSSFQQDGFSMADYRKMFIQRSMDFDEAEEGSYTEWDRPLAVQPVTFVDSQAPSSRNAWWRRQLHMDLEEDTREAVYMSRPAYSQYARPGSYVPETGYYHCRPVHM